MFKGLVTFFLLAGMTPWGPLGYAAEFESFIRPFERVHPGHQYQVVRLPFSGLVTEGYMYADARDGLDPILLEANLMRVLKYFDETVYSQFLSKVGVNDPGFRGQDRSENKIILLFDANLPVRAHHSPRMVEAYQRDFILIDLREAMESNALQYRLPHELQHVFRYHHNVNESDWLNEGLSEFIEYLVNDEFPVKSLMQTENLGLQNLTHDYATGAGDSDYFYNFFFVFYLYKHYGGRVLIQKLIQSREVGEASIDRALKEQAEFLPQSQRDFYSFGKAFVNFQLALGLNPYRDRIESHGFFDLMLDSANVPKPLAAIGATITKFPRKGEAIFLIGGSARFYGIDRRCFHLEWKVETSLKAFLVDMTANKSEKAILNVSDEREYCLKQVKNTGQYLILINTNLNGEEPFIVH